MNAKDWVKSDTLSLLLALICLIFSSLGVRPVWASEPCDVHTFEQALGEGTPLVSEHRAALEAGKAFQAYFDAVGKKLHERGEYLDLIQQALIAREGMLLMGPPGNAKSMISDEVLGNIVDSQGQRSYYRIQMTPETTMSETHGPLDYNELSRNNRYVRQYGEGMLKSRNVFVDEIFDARANAQRNILGILAERAHSQGPRTEPGDVETFIGATNKYLSEVYEKAGDEGPKALIDRFSFSAYVPGEFEHTQSAVSLIQGAKRPASKAALPKLTFEQLDQIRALVPEVEIPDHVAQFLAALSDRMRRETENLEQGSLRAFREKVRNGEEAEPPYRATKYHSPRSLGKAAGILRAQIVQDWLRQGGNRPLRATLEDVRRLESFFTLNGPRDEFVKELLERSTHPHEKAQLETILQERRIYRDQYESLMKPIEEGFYREIGEYAHEFPEATTPEKKRELAMKMAHRVAELEPEVQAHSGKLAELSGEQISREMLGDALHASGRELIGEPEWEKALSEARQKEHSLREARLSAEEAQRREAQSRERAQEEAQRKAREEEAKQGLRGIMGRLAEEKGLKDFFDQKVEPKSLCFVPILEPGKTAHFKMGSPESEPGHESNEILHDVTLTRPYEMLATPVTQLEWLLVMGENPSEFKKGGEILQIGGREVQANPNRPVEKVSWNGAQAFIEKLNQLDPRYYYRLPTDAEWEYAIRAGTETPYPHGSDPKGVDNYAWHRGNSGEETHDVAGKKPNAWGLHDMQGNVLEWAGDWFGTRFKEHETDPTGQPTGVYQVVRGGDLYDDTRPLRSAWRGKATPHTHYNFIGFRLVRTPR